MISQKRISQKGIDLIKRFEGLKLKAYVCPDGVWTIGYGHTRTAFAGMKITEAEAERLLLEDLKNFEAAINSLVIDITQGQFDALCSLVFNIGIYAFEESNTRRMIISNPNNPAIAGAFRSWRRDRPVSEGGVILPGLVARREAEIELYFGA
jgi:lysozyme